MEAQITSDLSSASSRKHCLSHRIAHFDSIKYPYAFGYQDHSSASCALHHLKVWHTISTPATVGIPTAEMDNRVAMDPQTPTAPTLAIHTEGHI